MRLCGRTEEQAAAHAALEHLARGEGGLLSLEGEAGIGKSALLDDLVEQARTSGVRVVRCAAYELERHRPFHVLTEPFGVLVGAGPEESSATGVRLVAAGGAEAQNRLVDALLRSIDAMTAAAPLLVVCDDLQWADPASLTALGAIARTTRSRAIGLVGAWRPFPWPPELISFAETVRRLGGTELVLRPIDDAASEELIELLLGSRPGPLLRRLTATAGGNPLLIRELVLGLETEESLIHGDDGLDAMEAAVPERVKNTVRHRLRSLPTEHRRILQVAAVLGSRVDLSDLASVLRLDLTDVLASIEALTAHRLLEDRDGRLHFVHDLVRSAVYEALPGAVRAAVHRDVARSMMAAGRPAAIVATHLLADPDATGPEVFAHLRLAARSVSEHSPTTALELYDAALERATAAVEPHHVSEVRAERLRPLLWSGRSEAAIAEARELLEALPAESPLAATVNARLGNALVLTGQVDEAIEVVQMLSTQMEAAQHLTALADLVVILAVGGDVARAIPIAEQGFENSVASGVPEAMAVTGAVMALFHLSRGRFDASVEASRIALEHLDATNLPTPRLYLGMALSHLGQAERAVSVLREDAGAPRAYQTLARSTEAACHFFAGRWDAATAAAESAAESAEGGLALGGAWAWAITAHVAHHRGDEPAAAEAIARSRRAAAAEAGSQLGDHWTDWIEALRSEATGDSGQAVERLSAVDEAVGGIAQHITLLFAPDFARTAMSAGEGDEAQRLLARLEKLTIPVHLCAAVAAVERVRGLVEDRADILSAAAESYLAGSRRFEAGLTFGEAALAAARQGDDAAARALLHRCHDELEPIGADSTRARITATARNLGVRIRRTASARAPSEGWESLTRAERAVVELVAEGMSNPQVGERLFISRRTVAAHLTAAFRKLGVSSRGELASTFHARNTAAPR